MAAPGLESPLSGPDKVGPVKHPWLGQEWAHRVDFGSLDDDEWGGGLTFPSFDAVHKVHKLHRFANFGISPPPPSEKP